MCRKKERKKARKHAEEEEEEGGGVKRLERGCCPLLRNASTTCFLRRYLDPCVAFFTWQHVATCPASCCPEQRWLPHESREPPSHHLHKPENLQRIRPRKVEQVTMPSKSRVKKEPVFSPLHRGNGQVFELSFSVAVLMKTPLIIRGIQQECPRLCANKIRETPRH